MGAESEVNEEYRVHVFNDHVIKTYVVDVGSERPIFLPHEEQPCPQRQGGLMD